MRCKLQGKLHRMTKSRRFLIALLTIFSLSSFRYTDAFLDTSTGRILPPPLPKPHKKHNALISLEYVFLYEFFIRDCITEHSQKNHRPQCCQNHSVASCQFYRLVATQQACQFKNPVKIRLFATYHLQTCYNLSKQVATNLLK